MPATASRATDDALQLRWENDVAERFHDGQANTNTAKLSEKQEQARTPHCIPLRGLKGAGVRLESLAPNSWRPASTNELRYSMGRIRLAQPGVAGAGERPGILWDLHNTAVGH